MPPLTRGAKLRHIAATPRSACDWLGEVFASKDLGPLVLQHVEDLEDIVSCARTCRALRFGTMHILFKLRLFASEVENDPQQLAPLACIDGNVRLYKFCIRRGAEINEGCAEAAIAGGHIHILRHMHFVDSNYKLGVADMAWAAHRGQRPILEWLKGLGIQWDERALSAAASAGHTDCLELILDKGHILKMGETFAGSRESFCDLDANVWPRKCTGALECAAEGGHLDCVKLIKEKCALAGLSIPAANKAAGNGHLHVLEWMWPQMNAWGANIGIYAVEGDHVECFRFVYEKLRDAWEVHIPWDLMFQASILLGKPKCLRFMLGTGRFVVLDLMRHQMLTQADAGPDCLRACAEHGVEFTAEELTTAALGVNFGTVTVLVNELKVPWEEKILEKLVLEDNGSPGMIAHCLELGAPAAADFVMTLCLRGELSVLKHFLAKRNPVFEDINMQACVKRDKPACARALIDHYDNKEKMRAFVQRVYAHACSDNVRHKKRSFMKHVFE